jgi:hypothetical protein
VFGVTLMLLRPLYGKTAPAMETASELAG